MCVGILLSLLIGGAALADDGSGTSELRIPAPTQAGANSVPDGDKVDEVLTNPNLRAYAGSKSRWSISNSINYDGGTVSNPFGESRPNIANASATSDDTDINDQISVKYNIDAMNSVLFGVGVRKMTPFTGTGPSAHFRAQGGKDVDMYDPTLTYQYVYKFMGVQSVAQLYYTQYTREDIHSSQGGNLDKNLSFDQESMYEIGRWSIGASIGFGGNTATDPTQDYSRYQVWLDPDIEFALNDTYNLRAIANAWSYEWYPKEKMLHDTYSQSLGVGISVTRDVFLYPNVQFLPSQMAWSQTNLGMTATVNLF